MAIRLIEELKKNDYRLREELEANFPLKEIVLFTLDITRSLFRH